MDGSTARAELLTRDVCAHPSLASCLQPALALGLAAAGTGKGRCGQECPWLAALTCEHHPRRAALCRELADGF